MKVALKVIVGVFALLGLAFTVLTVIGNVRGGLTNCSFARLGQAIAPGEEHVAVFEQHICKESGRSRSSVLVSKRDVDEEHVALEIPGTNRIGLTWASGRELVISYPSGVAFKKYDIGEGWPMVTLKAVTDP